MYEWVCASSELKMLDTEFFIPGVYFRAIKEPDKLKEFNASRAKSVWRVLVENMFS